MPTSVLLAVLAAAGLLALAPALVRRYDATERLIAERALSTARVISRRRRRQRTIPGRRLVNPPAWLAAAAPSAVPLPPSRVPRKPALRPSVFRRRQVLASLLLLNLVQLIGVALVGPGFWISASVTAAMLVLYLGHLRGQALRMARRRRAEARQAAWLAEQQARVRLAQEQRAEARREAARILEEELQRARELEALAAAAATEAAEASRKAEVVTISYRKPTGVRGRPYEVRKVA
ncbi:divisome protein SepX/GlpR [Catelliglobosispora koreensis]|uniref:divisome protein SepX/GlpR n=1 Tax=Catelliglobosispora koreensis TaxID=129052 RepID=UPI00037C67F2|nr:hypothetical protein [Catelliglobosispora koreensis]